MRISRGKRGTISSQALRYLHSRLSLTSPWPEPGPLFPLSQFLNGEWELHGLDQDVVLCGLEAWPSGTKFFLCTWNSESSQISLPPVIRAFLRPLVPSIQPRGGGWDFCLWKRYHGEGFFFFLFISLHFHHS